LELIKDYDLEIHYHPGKANLVVDALSWKGQVHAAIVTQLPDELANKSSQNKMQRIIDVVGIEEKGKA
jgi:hypothetical protein